MDAERRRQVLPVASELRRPRQHQPQDRRGVPDDAPRDGPALRHRWRHIEAGRPREFVTGNNDADGVYLLHWVRARFPEREAAPAPRSSRSGAAMRRASTSPTSTTSATSTPTRSGGTTRSATCRERPFSAIWQDTSDPLLAGMKARAARGQGPLRRVRVSSTSAAATRACARWQLTGDPWAEDPGCYLDDDEIGIAGGYERVPLKPYIRVRRPTARNSPMGTPASRRSRSARSRRMRVPLALRDRLDGLRDRRGADHRVRRRGGRAGRADGGAELSPTHCASLPRRRPPRRHRARAAAGEPRAAAQARRRGDDRARAGSPRRCRRSATSCRRRRSTRWSRSSTRRRRRKPVWGEAQINATRVVAPRRRHAARQAGVRAPIR